MKNLIALLSCSLAPLLLLCLATLLHGSLNAQTRGTSPGELYYSTTWYAEAGNQYDMVIHTADNGKHFKPVYVYKHNTGKTPVGNILSDATPGVLYMQAQGKLYISNDSAKNWEFVENIHALIGNYSTGNSEGELYKTISNEEKRTVELYRSSDFGYNFNLSNDSIGFTCEVGTNEGDIYLNYLMFKGEPYKIYYSNNKGEDFSLMNSFDTTIAGNEINGHTTQIYRGMTSGELYLVSWHHPANYKIFRSTDYGKTFELQYEQPDTCNFFWENYGFTAGRSPGEFYIFKRLSWFDGNNTKLHVYYSADYAQTFTEYVHVLNKNWTSLNEKTAIGNNNLTNYPNPFTEQTTITYASTPILKKTVVEIFNISGVLIKTIPFSKNSVVWNSNNNKPGIYFYRLKNNNFIKKHKL